MSKTISSCVLLTSLLFTSFNANAFRLEPMLAEFTPTGSSATKVFRVENESNEKVAVKLKMTTRVIDENGKEENVDSSDFKIYPEQVSLDPSDSRAIRVVYIGKKQIDMEQNYRLFASQLPVSFKNEKPKTGVKFLYQFVASVYVTSDKYSPKVEVESFERIDKNTAKISLVNKGQRHVLLKGVKVELFDGNNKTFRVGPENSEDWDSINILSGSRRIVKVKTDKDFDLAKNPAKVVIENEIR